MTKINALLPGGRDSFSFPSRLRATAFLIFLAGVLWASANSAGAAFPGQNGKIAFSSDRTGNWEIFVMGNDGSAPTDLTNNGASDNGATWSPDGKEIAFHSNRDGNQEVYVMNADGSGQARLTNNSADDGLPAWSPDGSKLAFASNRDGNMEVYVMNADGSGQTRLTDHPATDYAPSWSPASIPWNLEDTSITFVSSRDDSTNSGNWEIYSMNPDGSGQTRLTNNSVFDDDPNWSPDGERIIFQTDVGVSGEGDLWTMSASGADQAPVSTTSGGEEVPAWSPDGTRIVFGAGDKEIHVMDADGSNLENLTDSSAWDHSADWQPLDSAAPMISDLRIGGDGVSAATSGASQASKSRITYRLSESARIKFLVRRKHGSRKSMGDFSIYSKAGRNRVSIPRSVKKRVARGAFRVEARATDIFGNRSKKRSVSFRVK